MYIGVYEIKKEYKIDKNHTKVSYKSYKHKVGLEMTTDNMPDEVYENTILELVKTKEATDFNYVRDGRCTKVSEDILKVLLKYNIKISEINHICGTVASSIVESEKRAITQLFGNRDDQNRTLLDLEKVLKN